MGCLAMAVTLMRGAAHGWSIDATLGNSIGAMLLLAAVGAVVGAIAQWTVDESVRSQLEEQLAGAGDLLGPAS